MSADRYLTLAGESTGTYREKASKFIGYAFPISDEAGFRARCEAIAKAEHSARHCCYAWVLGPDDARHRANDAGEPAGTAGRPILRQLQARGLTQAAVVVVRYFGGTLLGKAGLVHAYGEAAHAALDAGTTIARVVRGTLTVTCGYEHMQRVKRDAVLHDGEVLYAELTDRCVLHVAVALGALEALAAQWRQDGLAVDQK
ncbi:MAG TPA: YigZ family protein [Flavobacteriales bacterium]